MLDSVKKQLEKQERMKKCLYCKSSPVQWHHALVYAGRKLEDWWAIQPLCYKCHMGNSMKPNPVARIMSEIAAIEMGLEDGGIMKYGKRNWNVELNKLRNDLQSYSQY